MSWRCVRWHSMLRRFGSTKAETSTRVVTSASGRPNSSSSASSASEASPAAAASSLVPGPRERNAALGHRGEQLLPALPGPGELVEAIDRVRAAGQRRVRLTRDPRGVDVVGMAVVAVLVVRHDRGRPSLADDLDQPARGDLEVGLPEGVGMGVGIGPDHSGVAIAEQVVVDGTASERVERAGQLGGPDGRQPGPGLLRVEGRVVHLALGAIGAGDEIDADALGHEARDAATGADAFVVRVGVDEEDPAGLRRHGRRLP